MADNGKVAMDGYNKFMVKPNESQIKERPAPPAPINKPVQAAPVAAVTSATPKKK